MNVVRWSPFREFDNLFQALERPAAPMRRADWLPLVDIRETPEDYQIDVEVPAVASEDLSVDVADNVLTVSGERKEEEEEKGKTYHRVERRVGSFSRSMTLPCPVEEDEVVAAYCDGVLSIMLPKTDEAKTRKIKIKT